MQKGYRRPWRHLCAAACLGWLAACFCATAQVSVDTIGGGVRVECGSNSGFVGGNTYETAQFNAPFSCALDTNGNLWIADKTNNDLEQVTEAGNKSASTTIQYYTGTAPHTNYHAYTNITGVAVDPANNLYVLLPSPPMVLKYDLASSSINELSTLVLTNTPAGAIASALAVDASSNVFLAFTNGVILRFPLLDSNPPPTVYSNNFTLGASAKVHYVVTGFNWQPAGLALMANGQLAVSDMLSNAIYVVSTNDYSSNTGPHLMTGANNGGSPGYDDGPATYAMFDQPRGLAASADGRLIVCDTMNNRLRVIDTFSNTTTLYGTASNVWTATCCTCAPTYYSGWVDGVAGVAYTNASGREPVSVAISPSGSLFVTELYYSLIRQVTNVTFTPVNLSAVYPVAFTEPASGLTTTNASLNGTVNAGGESTYYFFEWGLTTNYGNDTPTNLLTVNLTATEPVSAAITGLSPGATYHFQLVAFNGLGYVHGGDLTAVTLPEPPVVTTQPATGVTNSGATLNASVDPEYSPTTVYFQYGPATNYGNTTALINLTTNLSAAQPVSATVGNLQSGTIYYFQAVAVNSGGTAYGNQLVFSTPYVPPPTLSISPSNGYFPNCVAIAVTSSVPTVYYTTDGVAPTTNSEQVAMSLSGGSYVGSIEWCNPQQNLSQLEVLAGSGSNTVVLQGGSPTANSIGFPQPLFAGSGGHVYLPVVVDLQSNIVLQSLQFRVEITPNEINAPMIAAIGLQPLTTNDMVPLPGPAPGDAPVTFASFSYTIATTQGLEIVAEPGSGLDMGGSGVVVMLHLQIPTNAAYGQSYSLNVVDPSGTSATQPNGFSLNTLAQTLTVSDPAYFVGDSSPATGYNAAQFGDGALNNADVNNAIYASMGIRVPPVDSDLYSDMDAYPPDNGDGQITFLDWQTILNRSLGLDTNNWIRFRTNGGALVHQQVSWTPGGVPVPLSAAEAVSAVTKLSSSSAPPGLVWLREAAIGANTKTNVAPGSICSIPVYVNVLPGYSLSGLQFRAVVSAVGSAPAPGAITFSSASGVPAPIQLPGLASNDIVCAWALGAFATALQNSNYLGVIAFQVPSAAQAGQSYALHFLGVDGSPNINTLYQLESFPGSVWVNSAALQPASLTSDEWKLAFFGSLTNALAADDADADGDGMANWQEYLAGTNPTNALSCLQFSSPALNTAAPRGVAMNWLTAPGKTYILESSAALRGSKWTAINTNLGDGNNYQFLQTNCSSQAGFYQLRLQP